MSGITQAVFMNQRSFGPVPGQDAYTTAGTYCWVAPTNVTTVSAVVVGGGNATGGSLRYKNNIATIPGNSYTVVVGIGGTTGNPSSFISNTTLRARGGGSVVTQYGDGGGCGGTSAGNGGGGAGGYAGNGGAGGANNSSGQAGAGGGGGGGAGQGCIGGACGYWGGGGGGVGILGQGSNGAAGIRAGDCAGGGGGGSGGANGLPAPGRNSGCRTGGAYGGGRGLGSAYGGQGGVGAVRIIWPGNTRSFPSTDTGNL